jgi:hypothetical protein
MIKAIAIVQAILIASTVVALAQRDNAQPVSQAGQPPEVLGQTGSMYDGNNANLQLPAEPNEYWARLWAAPISTANTGPASSAGPAAASSSVSGPPVGGVH